jgi:sugar O-acyltransferase (sialic acid O-acetyltransferase NeuD family)
MRIAIIGSGDLAKQLTHYAVSNLKLEVIGYFDDFLDKGTLINNIPILGAVNDILPLFYENKFDKLLIGIGYKYFSFRVSVFEKFKGVIPFTSLIHKSCVIDPSVTLGEGVVIFPGSIIDMNVKLADNVLLNIGCVIAHDTAIEKHTFLAPAVKIAGFVTVGEQCNIGINTTIIDNIKIVDMVKFGGGTVVIKNINKPGLYVGNPQRFVR